MEVLMLRIILVLLCWCATIKSDITVCPKSCQCIEEIVKCSRFPSLLKRGTKHVFVSTAERLLKNMFSGEGWDKVLSLDISGTKTEEIFNNTFVGLESLERLGIHSRYLYRLGNGSLNGLGNVKNVDLSACMRLSSFFVFEVLKDKTAVPKLETLNLNSVNELREGPVKSLAIDKHFAEAIQPRNLSELHLQRMHISFIDEDALLPLCLSLEIFDINWAIVEQTVYIAFENCKSFRKLSVSNCRYGKPIGFKTYKPSTRFELDAIFWNFFANLIFLEMNHIVTGESPLRCYNCSIRLTNKTGKAAEMMLREFDFEDNKLRYFDVEFTGDIGFSHVVSLSLGKNQMEYLCPRFFYGMIGIRILDLSMNELWRMQWFNQSMFSKLTTYLPELEDFDLSYNNLTNLPPTMFDKNSQLKNLNLTGNFLNQIYFNSKLPLFSIDLRYNTIHYLRQQSRSWIDSCNELTGKLKTYITNNPLACSCSSSEFLSWMFNSPSVYLPQSSVGCTYDGKQHIVTKNNLSELQAELCYKAPIALIVIGSIGCTTALVSFTIFARRTVKKLKLYLKRQKTRTENLALLKRGQLDTSYLAFLSFCNDDGQFVMNHIYPALLKECQRIPEIDVDEDTIGVGDLHFRPGFSLHNEMIRCVQMSNVFLAVVSDKYCQSPYCRQEMDIAYTLEKPIILLILDKIDKEKMFPILKLIFNKYSRLLIFRQHGRIKIRPSWKRLVESILEMPTSRDQHGNPDDRTSHK